MKKGSKKITKTPFAKRPYDRTLGLIVALTVFNLVYSYGVGLPLPRAVVSAYVEAVEELGDAQVAAYQTTGALVMAAINLPAAAYRASVAESQQPLVEAPVTESLLTVAPNQISIAK